MKQATKDELREEIKALRFTGRQMSNALYNLSQKKDLLDGNITKSLKELYESWDAIKRSELNE